MLLVGTANDTRVPHHRIDNRLVGWQDVMPTLLDLAGIEIPEHVEGLSMVGEERRTILYGECGEDSMATRMVHDGRYKLVYYPVGNRVQLFDLENDPNEQEDLAGSPRTAAIQQALTEQLLAHLYGSDLAWVKEGALVGLPDRQFSPRPDRGLSGQRGIHWPPPPLDNSGKPVGAPG
jgi:arylsulfatase A-like enzyme